MKRAIWACSKPGWLRRRRRCRRANWWRKSDPRTKKVARAAPGRTVTLATHGIPTDGGIRVRLANNLAQLDQTVEARYARLADELARVVMERLFASAPDLGTLVHG